MDKVKVKLRAGIVGCGSISKAHARAYLHLADTELVSLCDNNPKALEKHATEFSVNRHYTDYREMFASENLDLVSICTQAPIHAPVAIAAAESKIHVLCEKPISLDLEIADQMVESCKRAGVSLAVSHQYRFSPNLRRAKNWIESGRIGQLHRVHDVGKGREAGFELMEMGVHYFDEMDFLMGGIAWVHAQISFRGREVGVEDIMHSSELCKNDRRDNGMVAGDTMLIHLGGRGGVCGLIELYRRQSLDGWLWGPHILGDTGQIMIKPNPRTGDEEMWYCPSDVSFPAHTPPWEQVEIEKQANLIEGKPWPERHPIWSVRDFVSAIRDGHEPELGGSKACTSLECVSAVYESHFTGARVHLPLDDRRHPLVKRLER